MTIKGHILLIHRVFPPDAGAGGLRVMELCQGLAEQNWRITVLTNKGRNVAPDNLHPNITLKRLSFGSLDEKPSILQNIAFLWAFFFRALAVKNPDIVITLTDPPLSSVVSACLKIFRRVKIINWVHEVYPELYPVMGVRMPIMQPLLEKISHWALRRHDALVAIDDDMKDLLDKMVQHKTPIHMIPHWPDVKVALLDKKKPLRHDSDNPFVLEGVFSILYSGNFSALQDFEPLIEAMKIVNQSPHPVRFIMAGNGVRFAEIRDRIERMQLSNVHFMRAQPKDKFMDMLLAGDVHLSTVIPEATGLVVPSKINSALGLSRPCIHIGTVTTFQSRLIKDHQAGVVVDPNDPHAKFIIAEAVINYATDAESYHRAQGNALKAAQAISFEKGVTAFDHMLIDLLPKKTITQ